MPDEPRTVIYRVRAGPWGLWVRLTASAEVSLRPPGRGERVADRLWLDTRPVRTHPPAGRNGVRLHAEEAAWLRHGLEVAAPALPAPAGGAHLLVRVHRVAFPETDYQPEGLAAALLLWLEEEFTLPPHPVCPSFDRAANRYAFAWSGPPRPSSPGTT